MPRLPNLVARRPAPISSATFSVARATGQIGGAIANTAQATLVVETGRAEGDFDDVLADVENLHRHHHAGRQGESTPAFLVRGNSLLTDPQAAGLAIRRQCPLASRLDNPALRLAITLRPSTGRFPCGPDWLVRRTLECIA